MERAKRLSSTARTVAALFGALATMGALLGVACPQAEPVSEQGHFRLEDHDLATRTGFFADGWWGGPVLVGERTCPQLACQQQDCSERAPEDGGVAACFAQTVSGAAFAEGCLTFDTPGDVIWALEPVACQPAPDAGVPLVGDRFVFRALGPEAAVAQQGPRIEQLAVEMMADGGVLADPAPPADLAAPRDELRIVEGGQAPVSATLTAVEVQDLVAVEGDSLVVEDIAPTPDSVRVRSGWLIEAEPGATAALRLVTRSASFDVASIEGVPVAEAASMSLFAFSWTSAESPGVTAPAAAHALVLDPRGRRLDGAPVEWTLVQGDLAVSNLYSVFADADDEDDRVRRGPWMTVFDGCRLPSTRAGTATALLRARLGELQQDLRFTWTLPPDQQGNGGWLSMPPTTPEEDQGFTRDPACPPFPACGCASTRTGGRAPPLSAAGPVAALLAVLLWLRRRPPC